MAHLAERHIDTIDLVSSDDEADGLQVEQEGLAQPDQEDVEMPDFYTPPHDAAQPVPADFPHPPHWDEQLAGSVVVVDGEEVFIPDDLDLPGPAPPEPAVETCLDEELAMALASEYAAVVGPGCNNYDAPLGQWVEVNADQCLQQVLTIFPDISHDYVIKLFDEFEREGDYQVLAGDARLENIIEQLVSNPSYPKQEKGNKALKRKRQDSIEDANSKRWENADRVVEYGWPKHSTQSLLKAEFPDIPISYINAMLSQHKHLYQTYLVLYRSQEDNNSTTRRYGKGRASSKVLADADTIAVNSNWPPLVEELDAARMKIQILKSEKEAQEVIKTAEKENLARAIAAGETAECTACYDDLPMNRQIHCDGEVTHFVCFDCALVYIKSEVGESRCRVLCTAGCGAGFAGSQLALLSDKQLLEKLAQLQQEKDIRDAGLEDLEECPFCDYKAILPPIEEDFEFRCPNPDCERVSCRRCKSVSHIPLSCEEHAKDGKVNSRHKIEEAMTTALIRKCNKCSKSFIKEYGCNKMACPSCGNLQCYVCSTTIKDYNHFDQSTRATGAPNPNSKSKLCPLYDNVEERHEREVKAAEDAARAQVVEDNPDLTAEDLEIKVSDAVKRSVLGPAGIINAAFADLPGAMDILGGQHGVFNLGRPNGILGEDDHDQGPHNPPAHRHRHHHRRDFQRRRDDLVRAHDYINNHLLGGGMPLAPPAPAAPIQAPPPPAPAQQPAHGRVQGYIPVIGFHAPPMHPPLYRAPARPAVAAPPLQHYRGVEFVNPNPGNLYLDPLFRMNNDDLFNPAPNLNLNLNPFPQPPASLSPTPRIPPPHPPPTTSPKPHRWSLPPIPTPNNAFPQPPQAQPPPQTQLPPKHPRPGPGPHPAQQRHYANLEHLREQHDQQTRERHERLLLRHAQDQQMRDVRLERMRELQERAARARAERAEVQRRVDLEIAEAGEGGEGDAAGYRGY